MDKLKQGLAEVERVAEDLLAAKQQVHLLFCCISYVDAGCQAENVVIFESSISFLLHKQIESTCASTAVGELLVGFLHTFIKITYGCGFLIFTADIRRTIFNDA